MKPLITLSLLCALSFAATAQTKYEELPATKYNLKVPTALAYKKTTDTTDASVRVPQADGVLIVGRQVPNWAVIKRAGFIYYMPARYIVNFSGDPAADALQLAKNRPKTEEYCEVLASSNDLFGKEIVINVDYGQQRKMWRDNREKDEYGNVQKFNSVIDALNFMNSQGWEIVNAFPITHGNSNVYHYLLRRHVTQ